MPNFPRTLLLASGLLAAWGCGPPEITRSLPPGMEPIVQEVPEDERSQALGEQGNLGTVETPIGTTPTGAEVPLAPATPIGQPSKTESGVEYETIREGTGALATPGKTAVIHYDLKLTSGQAIENSRRSGQTYRFRIAPDGGAIAGMVQGVAGMKVGEVRRLTIPPELGYGGQVKGEIPANSTLVFEVELMNVAG